jgi:aryl-phospho-beta-D-glucosidase BglC (GH1 family)
MELVLSRGRPEIFEGWYHHMTKDEWYAQLFERLDNSKFRSSFHLKQKDIDYINEKGMDTIRDHPVFIAQHAAATCCRECIRKWHKLQPGRELSQAQQDYLVDVIMTWIEKEYANAKGV